MNSTRLDGRSLERLWKRQVVVILIALLIAVAHILPLEKNLRGVSSALYFSYFSDFVIPFAWYFLLSTPLDQFPVLRRWQVKFALAFLTPALAETLQYFGVPALGITFDPLDYVAYGLGALAAVIVDRQLFARIFPFWDHEG